MPVSNPCNSPQWHAIRRESVLARDLIGSGVTALGRANYADQLGQYYSAFFGLSVGLERLSKLVLVVDHALSNHGQMPSEDVVRRYGHRLTELLNKVDQIALEHGAHLTYQRPKDIIALSIVDCLDSFADARRGRYANFGSLDTPNLSSEEPIKSWWELVAHHILSKHYEGKQIQRNVESRANMIDSIMSGFTHVLHVDESEQTMDNVRTASVRTGQTKVVQKFGRYHTLTTVRWLSDVYTQLAKMAAYQYRYEAFFGSWEFLQTYTVDDSFLKSRKVWPLA
ncbi:hypothetical protein SAMN04487880_3449 [Marinobacter sp. es.042]|uniref:hypothetical protein n=1 Tax=Marinobacter sp. es.042 TaxID=1761794 RepID=UPI000B509B59|nr:hypothetical protein [Marinobacter sp. es.042]SNB59171.1 hypothetical protein SAMN04487880_3449 [Marinobacter sp. es.042]